MNPDRPDLSYGDFYCKVCDTHINSELTWTSHIVGKRHIKNVAKEMPESSRFDFDLDARKDLKKELKHVEGPIVANEVYEKWRNLRTSFSRNLWLLPSDFGKPYYLNDAKFALPFIKAAGLTSGKLSPVPTENSEGADQETFVIHSPSLPESQETSLTDSSILLPTTSDLHSTASSLSSCVGEHSEIKQSSFQVVTSGPTKKLTRKKRSDDVNDAEKAVAEYFACKKAKIMAPSNSREESTKQFLNSLLPDLLSMSDVQLRAFKRSSLLIVDKILGTTPLELDTQAMYPLNHESSAEQQQQILPSIQIPSPPTSMTTVSESASLTSAPIYNSNQVENPVSIKSEHDRHFIPL